MVFDINGFKTKIVNKNCHKPFQEIHRKIWNVSNQISERLIAIRHLNKFESADISICKQIIKKK